MYKITSLLLTISILISFGCTAQLINLADQSYDVENREITSLDNSSNTISLNNQEGEGIAVIEGVSFETGTIELDLKGENTPGRSFVGFAFNVQNDSTFEVIYFRPFNFQSEEQIRREHSLQYISHPKNTWRYLRTNFEGQYEGEFPRRPSPDDWFTVVLKIDDNQVSVFDKETNALLLEVDRLEQPHSSKIGFWTGNNSKGSFRNLRFKD